MNEEVQRWLRKAYEDFRLMEHEMALPPSERVHAAVCFHAQQFVEKMLKAFLILQRREFPRTHNLGYLQALCAELDDRFQKLSVDELTIYAVGIRYPGEPLELEIEAEEAEECFRTARQVREFFEKELGIARQTQ